MLSPPFPARDIPSPGSVQSRTANYDAADRAAIRAGLRRCLPTLGALRRLHVAVAPAAAAVHPSQEYLARETGYSVSTVREHLDLLVDAGILGRAVSQATPTGDRGRWVRRTNRYWLNLGRIWGRIKAAAGMTVRDAAEMAGRTYRRSPGAMSSLQDAKSLGAVPETPPPPQGRRRSRWSRPGPRPRRPNGPE